MVFPVDDSTQSSKVIIIKCSHFAGFHGFNNRQRLHREYLFFKIFLVCPFHPCFVLLSRYWLCFDLRDYLSITINNGLPIWSLEPSCGIFFGTNITSKVFISPGTRFHQTQNSQCKTIQNGLLPDIPLPYSRCLKQW